MLISTADNHKIDEEFGRNLEGKKEGLKSHLLHDAQVSSIQKSKPIENLSVHIAEVAARMSSYNFLLVFLMLTRQDV